MPAIRKKEAASLVAHFITGVLGEDLLVNALTELSRGVTFQPDDGVKTMRGSLRGRVIRVLEDGKLVWCRDGGGAELISSPEALLPAD